MGLAAHLSVEPMYTPTAIPVSKDLYIFPEVIAHKAVISGNYCGNTILAIKESLGSNVDGIEVDVRKSKDGVLFLYHGEKLEEFTNGNGNPEDHNWEDLSKLSYRDAFGSTVVTLEELFHTVGNQKTIFLDIKHHKVFDTELVDALVQLIKKHNMQGSVIVESFNPVFLTQMRLAARDTMLMYNFVQNAVASKEESQTQFDQIPWMLKQSWVQKQVRRIVRPDVLGPRFNTDKNLLQHLIAKDYPLICWTVDDVNAAKTLYNMGVVGLETNVPNTVVKALVDKPKFLYDAGGTSASALKVVNITNEQDVLNAIKEAEAEGLKVTIAGRRHSMGGQTLLDKALQLNILPLNRVSYKAENKTIIAQAGATWKKIQEVANKHGRSIKVMQSDNIFTVGGSVSVNVHGWQVGAPPIASTITSMKVITTDGVMHRISKYDDPELFQVVTGGYGLFGILTEVEIDTTENSAVQFNAQFIPTTKLERSYDNFVSKNPNVELAYARLSVDKSNLFGEAGLFWFERKERKILQQDISAEKLVAVKRAIFRMSQYFNVGKKWRWEAEKKYSAMMANAGVVSRNDAMNTDIHILWPLYGKSKDILHEYFIPKGKLSEFIREFRKNIQKHDVNILNVTIREVRKDEISALPYATEDSFGLVCLFSQGRSDDEELKMKNFTQEAISTANALGGRFYLPYRLHYTSDQLLKSYPNIERWLALKKKYDPKEILDSNFYKNLKTLVQN